jgi:hypothetical protein
MDLPTLQQNATNATNQVADMQAGAPGMLDSLKQNLVSIFSKDNPIIGARNNALTDYLSESSKTRAAQLPANTGDVPGIAGRPLTYSPTQQDAMVTHNNAAALAPLAGYNEILKGMYGNIGDIVSGAGNIYNSTIQANSTRANGLMDLYKEAVNQDQFNRDLAYKQSQGSGSSGTDLASIIAAIQAALGTSTAQRPPLESFETADKAAPKAAAPKVNLSSTVTAGKTAQNNQPATGSNSDWALTPLLNWFKGWGAPQNDYASLSQLGLQ